MEHFFYLPSTMIWPLVACLVLTGIHVYLGVHVIARKVIFVDLALAQIAALGTVIGVLLGFEVGKDITQLYLYSLSFTIFGAFIFSVTKMKGERVPHEAIIGIVYAVTFAATMLVLSQSALGPQELDHIIKGELLWVQSDTVIKTAIIYSIVGIFHFVYRKKFMAISFNADRAEQDGLNVRLWDFLFYMSFGFVITSSVAIAGVFLVFSYLIIPSVGAMLLSEKLGTRLAIGWIGGSIISFIGVKLSWNTGLPTSPLIVCVLAAALILSGVIRYFKFAPKKSLAARNLVGAVAIIAVFVAGVLLFRKAKEDPLEHTLHLLESKLSTDRLTALSNLGAYADHKDVWLNTVIERLKDQDVEVRMAAINLLSDIRERRSLPTILPLLEDNADNVRHSAIQAVRALGSKADAPKLIEAAQKEEDLELKVELLRAALELGNASAVPSLTTLMEGKSIFAEDAYEAIRTHVAFEFDKKEVGKFKEWWKRNSHRLYWDEVSKRFVLRK